MNDKELLAPTFDYLRCATSSSVPTFGTNENRLACAQVAYHVKCYGNRNFFYTRSGAHRTEYFARLQAWQRDHCFDPVTSVCGGVTSVIVAVPSVCNGIRCVWYAALVLSSHPVYYF